MASEQELFETLVKSIEPRGKLLRAWKLEGGVSARVTALEVQLPDGQKKKMVARQHGGADLEKNPHVARNEFTLLKILETAGLPAPKSYYFDEVGNIFSTPCVVVEFIEGKTENNPTNLTDFTHQLTASLAKIHSVGFANADLSFLPRQEVWFANKLKQRSTYLDESLSESRIRNYLERVWPVQRHNKSVLLHGDFWQGNVLWKHDKLIAIIDWEDAAVGDPLSDVSNGRLETLFAFGWEVMNAFTKRYQFLMPNIDFTNLPYWDLCAALRSAGKLSNWGLDKATERKMQERHKSFVDNAFAKSSA